MNKIIFFLTPGLLILMFLNWSFFNQDRSESDFSEKVKIALRDVGHQLLIFDNDSTSLVLPITALDKSKFKLSFQNALSIEPDLLVSNIRKSFERMDLSKNYRVEVISCIKKEVSYSYEMSNAIEKSIIPCRGRILPKSCYTIIIKFTDIESGFKSTNKLLYIILLLAVLVIIFIKLKKKEIILSDDDIKELIINDDVIVLGLFHFYPEQNKLIKEAIEIKLSKKENELLTIFTNNPNQIIKREVLMKKVWEDKGVIVGRSLDTYISKLRKILKGDDSIKLVNVHGVGYKLIIK